MIPDQSYAEFSRQAFDRSFIDAPRPLKAQFEITYRCNIHCVHCYTDPFNTPAHIRREMSFGEISRLLDELARAGVLWLLLTGGEALVHPQFKQIYRAAKDRGFIVSLYTNGTTLTDSLVQFLAVDPPFQLEVSLHAATPETFEHVTQVPGSYQRCMLGIERMLAAGLPVKIKTKAMTVNRHELAQIKAFVEGLGLEFNLYTDIYPRLDGDLSSTHYRLPAADIVKLEFGGVAEGCNKVVPYEVPPDDRLFRCGCGTNQLTISPYGILRACTFTTWPAYDLKTMSVREAFQRLVEKIQKARYTGESPCRACPVYVHCDKNPVMALHEVGSMEAPVPHFCDVAYGRQAEFASLGFEV